jgi:serine O-acetyltransferase
MPSDSQLTLKQILALDSFRQFGSSKRRFFRLPLKFRYLRVLRKAHFAKTSFSSLFWRILLHFLSAKTGNEVPSGTTIGYGFFLSHTDPVYINSKVVIGSNCQVCQGVTIGQVNGGAKDGNPVIGDNCWLGPFAIVVGNVTIGDDVLIAGGAFVNFNVPSHSIVIGNPGKIIPGHSVSSRYLMNPITNDVYRSVVR